MSFAAVAKRRLPWLDTARIEQAERAQSGQPYADAVAELVITLFEELSAQTAARKAPQLPPPDQCPKCGCSARWCECKRPLLGPGDT